MHDPEVVALAKAIGDAEVMRAHCDEAKQRAADAVTAYQDALLAVTAVGAALANAVPYTVGEPGYKALNEAQMAAGRLARAHVYDLDCKHPGCHNGVIDKNGLRTPHDCVKP